MFTSINGRTGATQKANRGPRGFNMSRTGGNKDEDRVYVGTAAEVSEKLNLGWSLRMSGSLRKKDDITVTL